MKKLFGGISVLLALIITLSVPAFAVAIITGDGFGNGSKDEWVTDRYDPEEFDRSGGKLYLALGSKGYTKNREEGKQGKFYAQQGKKLACDPTTSNTWTATIKLEIDDTWSSTESLRKRAEFRVDLVDGSGNALEHSPAIVVIKGGSGDPVVKYYNPKVNTSWATAKYFTNSDKEQEELIIEEGWHTLIIKASKGVISYYFDEKKIGSCPLDTTDVYPSFMAVNAYNYNRPDVTCWDNCYLYDGSYSIRVLSDEAKEKREERLASQYAAKRERFKEKYYVDGRWLKEMPDSYWDY